MRSWLCVCLWYTVYWLVYRGRPEWKRASITIISYTCVILCHILFHFKKAITILKIGPHQHFAISNRQHVASVALHSPPCLPFWWLNSPWNQSDMLSWAELCGSVHIHTLYMCLSIICLLVWQISLSLAAPTNLMALAVNPKNDYTIC